MTVWFEFIRGQWRSQYGWKSAAIICAAVLAVFSLSGVGMAQVITGNIAGAVTDTTGAVIPNATVVITNLSTQAKRTQQTGASGDFAFNLLPPGQYSLRASAKGFQNFEVNTFTLAVGSTKRINMALHVGGTTQTVEVQGDKLPALQTTSATVQSTVSERQVQNLPLNGRNFVNLVQVMPGVNQGLPDSIASGNRPDDRRQTSAYSANGQPDTLNNNLFNGLDNNEREQGFIGVRPSIAAISQIHVMTNDYTAEVGRSTGAVVDVITKSGTNHFHGSLFEFVRNNIFDARNAFALPSSRAPELRQNDFGGSLGGPIWRKKTFFFTAVEWLRRVAGQTTTVSVPTAQEQNNFDFTDRPGGTKLSTSQINPVALRYFRLYPLPNRPGLINNYTASPNTTQYSTTFDVRVDHNFPGGDSGFAEYDYNPVTTNVPGVLPVVSPSWADGQKVSPGGSLFSFFGPSTGNSKDFIAEYTHIFSPNVVLQTRVGYMGIDITTHPLNYGENLSNKIGIINGNLGDQFTSALTPIQFLDGSATVGDGAFVPIIDHNNTYQLNGILTWSHGKQSITTGGALIYRQLNYYQSQWSPQGEFWTPSFESFLQGGTAFSARGNLSNLQGFRTWEPSGFLQDDWRINNWLTLNLGIRYDIFTPFTEAHNIFSNFDLKTLSVKVAGPGYRTVGVNTDYTEFAPRVGFAASLPHKMVLRGGYGISYYPEAIQSQIQNPNPPFNYICFPCFGTTFPVLPVAPAISSVSLTNPSGNLTYKPSNFRPGYYNQMNLILQKEIEGNVITIGYVGSIGNDLLFQEDINRPPPQTTPQPAGTPTPPRVYAKELPNVGQIQENSNLGTDNYNSLQVDLTRHYRAGLTFNFNYTWAHGLGDSVNPSGNNDNGLWTGNPRYDYSNTAVDIRDRIAFAGTYALPFGDHLNGAAGLAAKGWQLNAIAYWQTGLPFGVSNGVSPQINLPGVTSDRPNRYTSYSAVPKSVIAKGTVECLGPNNTGACFAPQAFGTAGDARQFSEYGPHQRSVNLSLFKNFAIYGHTKLQFRVETFNITNTPNFANPSGAYGTPEFGKISSTATNQNPREIQLAMKLSF